LTIGIGGCTVWKRIGIIPEGGKNDHKPSVPCEAYQTLKIIIARAFQINAFPRDIHSPGGYHIVVPVPKTHFIGSPELPDTSVFHQF